VNKASDFTELSNQAALNLIVRIKDRTSERYERLELISGQVAKVGRDWDSDLLIQDHYVDGHHLEIVNDAESGLVLCDKQSTNGSKVNGKLIAIQNTPYRENDVIELGDTRIEIFDTAKQIQPTLVRSRLFSFFKKFDSSAAIILVTGLAIVAVLIDAWFTSFEVVTFKQVVTLLSGTGAVLLSWALAFGFAGRLFRNESSIRIQWVLACAGLFVSTLLTAVYSFVQFNTHDASASDLLLNTLFAVIGIVFLFGTLSFSSRLSSGGKWAWSVLLVGIVFLTLYKDSLFVADHKKWNSGAAVEIKTLPPLFQISSAKTLEEHIEKTEQLFDDLSK
jgi:FOG: FHA domain